MPRYVDMFFKVSVPIKMYERLVEQYSGISILPDTDENFRNMIEYRLQGINRNITVTKDRPTQER